MFYLKMKYLASILILINLTGISCAKRSIVVTEEQIPTDLFYLDEQIKPFTGTCYVYYNNTKCLKEEMNYKKGILNGEHLSYYKNGNLKRKGSYNMGQMNGKWVVYDTGGNRIHEIEYKNDTLSGNFMSWYPTGIIKVKGNYTNNRQTGNWVFYDEFGVILSKVTL